MSTWLLALRVSELHDEPAPFCQQPSGFDRRSWHHHWQRWVSTENDSNGCVMLFRKNHSRTTPECQCAYAYVSYFIFSSTTTRICPSMQQVSGKVSVSSLLCHFLDRHSRRNWQSSPTNGGTPVPEKNAMRNWHADMAYGHFYPGRSSSPIATRKGRHTILNHQIEKYMIYEVTIFDNGQTWYTKWCPLDSTATVVLKGKYAVETIFAKKLTIWYGSWFLMPPLLPFVRTCRDPMNLAWEVCLLPCQLRSARWHVTSILRPRANGHLNWSVGIAGDENRWTSPLPTRSSFQARFEVGWLASWLAGWFVLPGWLELPPRGLNHKGKQSQTNIETCTKNKQYNFEMSGNLAIASRVSLLISALLKSKHQWWVSRFRQ